MCQDIVAQKVIDEVYNFFVKSDNFNGILLRNLAAKSGLSYLETIEKVKQLIEQDILTIQAGHNPFIITFFGTISKQIEVLEQAKSSQARIIDIFPGNTINSEDIPLGIYPTKSFLIKKRSTTHLETKPFTRMLSLGHSQLEAIFFDIDVLERYSKDPRYQFNFRDYSGSISYHVENEETPLVKESDCIF